MADKKPVSQWKGLNNVGEYTRMGLDSLSVADNVDVTSSGRIESREGFTRRIATPMSGGFSTKDHQRAYVVAGNQVCRVTPGLALVPLVTLTSSARMYWAELNTYVYFSNGVDYGRIGDDDSCDAWQCSTPAPVSLGVVPVGSLAPGIYQVSCTFLLADGRETGAGPAQAIRIAEGQALSITGIPQRAGASTRVYLTPANSQVFGLAATTTATAMQWNDGPDMLGEALQTMHLGDMPTGAAVIAAYRARMYAAMYLPTENASVVWYSKPLQYHLFDVAEDFLMVPGQVHMLADAGEALLIGTSIGIHAYNEESLLELATYGVVPGWPAAMDPDTKKVLMWTQRGICEALPFTNLTQTTVSVPPGAQAGLSVIERDGQKKLMATLIDGGTAFNQRL